MQGAAPQQVVVNSSDALLESSSITNAAVTPANARLAINRDGSLTSADTALVSGRTSSVALSWTASANAASYSGYWTLSSSSETQFVQNLTTSYIDSPLTAGSAHFYKVQAVKGASPASFFRARRHQAPLRDIGDTPFSRSSLLLMALALLASRGDSWHPRLHRLA